MSQSFAKLFSSILDSTIWAEPMSTRIVWMTMLAMTDSAGCVYASVPGLAKRALVERADVERALACFFAPDADSRSTEYEGRRIEKIDGGWRLLNYMKYSQKQNGFDRNKYQREQMAKKRAQQKKDDAERAKKQNAIHGLS